MGVSKYNSEGYHDPVVYEALTRIEAEERAARAAAAYRPLVYICSPYAGDVEKNTFRARAFSKFAVERHCIPIGIHSCSIWIGVQRYEPTNKGTDEADFGTETCPRRSSGSSMDDG